jgi:Predicted SAM-dependent methyltransferases
MQINREWTDYTVIATGDGMKLERWGKYVLLRPDPQIIWPSAFDLRAYKGLSAIYERSETGGGRWDYIRDIPENFTVGWRDFKFKLKLMGFKHTGLFPEQAVNWARMIDKIKGANRPINVLNLFAYTGGATVACLSAGASVCHVDSAKAMVERAGENIALSGLSGASVRYIIDDCFKFVRREIKRGKKYDAVIMDPPSFGRGANGEVWKIEDSLFGLVSETAGLLSNDPSFLSYQQLYDGFTTRCYAKRIAVGFKSSRRNYSRRNRLADAGGWYSFARWRECIRRVLGVLWKKPQS